MKHVDPITRCLLSNRGLFPEQAVHEARADYRLFTWVDTQDICYGPLRITQCAREDVIVMDVPIRWRNLP